VKLIIHAGRFPELPEGGAVEYERVAVALREAIASGAAPAGGQMPTAINLGLRYATAAGTVRRALMLLVDEGLVEAARGGRFVVAGAGVPAE
jgi:integrase